jgi:choline dehydrogenase
VQSFDYVVVGAGASGCVVANRLSADPAISVLVLEAGQQDDDARVHDPAGFVQLWGSDLDWQLLTEPQPALGNRQVMLNQGRVVGGSTSLNALMWVRGNPRNFDAWAAGGADGWAFADLLPYFKQVEDYGGGASDVRGAGGPVSVLDNPDPASRSEAFLAGLGELGYDGPHWDYNGVRQEDGAGPLQFSVTREGARASAAVAYLDPVRHRPNLTVTTGAHVTRLLCEGTRVVGVEYARGGQTHQARARDEVVVSAGALHSPKLLMLSGIGPAEHLREHGIPVVADLPGVGQNLQDHLQLPVVYASTSERPLPYLLTGNTLFTSTRDRPGAAPDLQLNFTPAVPAPLEPVLGIPVPVGIFLPILIQPDSTGSVRLRSARPQDAPVVDPRYLSEEADLQTLREAVRIIRELVATPAMAGQYRGEIAPGPDVDLDGYIRSQSSTLWHAVGTCRMGGDVDAVVDAELRVRGVEGVRVADASVMPTVTSGNTQAACYVIGEKAADLLLRRRPAPVGAAAGTASADRPSAVPSIPVPRVRTTASARGSAPAPPVSQVGTS